MRHLDFSRHLLLERADILAEHELSALQDAVDGPVDLLPEPVVLRGEVQDRDGHA
jgi:hypothetical protein